MKKNIIIICVIIALALIARFFYATIMGFIKGKAVGLAAAADVEVQKVKTLSIRKSFEAPGRVVSKYQVKIVARVSGYLEKSYFNEGSCVKKGDALFLIEPAQYQEEAGIANADISKISAQLDYANKQLARATELLKQDYIAKAKYDEILSNRNSLSAQLNAAKTKLADKKRNLGYTSIKAPVDGRIGTIDVTVGNYVTPSSGALTTINSTNPIYVTFPLSSDDYSDITSIDNGNNKKRKVELYFNNGDKYIYEGVQDFWDNEVDPTTGTVTFRATFSNPDNRLLHGEFVKVKIFANNNIEVPVVPITAVMSNQEGKYVYKLDNNNLPQINYITDGGQKDNYLIINKGLNIGDKIITEGLAKVYPNKKVNIISEN